MHFWSRDLEKKEKERKEKEREEKRRLERKNRDAFKELLKTHREEGKIQPKMRWKVVHISVCWVNNNLLRLSTISQ